MIGNFQTLKSLNVREREYRCLCSYYVINTYASLMYELKNNWKGIYEYICWAPGPRLIKKIIYRVAVSQRLVNTVLACSPHLTKIRLAGTELFRAGSRTDRHGEAIYNFPNWSKNGSLNCKIIDLGH
jgi:hypothetical protein